ncbi:MAG: hypothetical protein ACOC9W_00480 [Persicimonas sp.]
MNNDTNTFDGCTDHVGPNGFAENNPKVDAQLEEELRWMGLNMLALLGKYPPASSKCAASQLILFASNVYAGDHPERFAHMCRGLKMMTEGRFRRALGEFEAVLQGRVDRGFEPMRELALQAHSLCLQHLDYDDEALEQFTRLLHTKFEETRDYGEGDHVAELLGLVRSEAR